MFSLSLWRGLRSDSSERTTSTNTNSNSNTTEGSWTPSGKSNSTVCENILPFCSALPETKQLVVKQAVKKLFEDRHFSICTLDRAIDLIGARQGGEAYKMLHTLHCVDYDKMPPELREKIPHLVNECLRQQNNVIEATNVALKGVL